MATPSVLTAETPTRCGIYTRISRDDLGDMLGVRRQQKDAEALAAKKGWTVAEVYVDDDVSAYSGRQRPSYNRMLSDIASGTINAVVAYDLDRLHRLPTELESFFAACDRAGVTKLATVAGDVDLASSDGQLIARIMGAVAKKSSDDASRRIKRRFQDDAAAGKPHGPRAFGYNADRLTINKDEAKIVTDMVRRVLSGEPLNAIARDLNDRGIAGPQGGRGWAGTTVRAVVSNPRLAGLRAHHGVIVAEAAWPGIIDRATHERVVAFFNQPGRSRTSPARLNLLSGLCFCGRCGSPLTYLRAGVIGCSKAPGRPNCGGLTISAAPLERLITDSVIVVIDNAGPLLVEAGADDEAALVEAQALEDRMVELGEMFAAGDITRGEWVSVKRSLEARLAEARRSIAGATRARNSSFSIEGPLAEAWPDLPLARRRLVIEAVIDKITVAPATRRGPRFDTGRVKVSWRA